MLWRALAFSSLAYLAADLTLQLAPSALTAQVVAWQADARERAACHVAMFTSRIEKFHLELG